MKKLGINGMRLVISVIAFVAVVTIWMCGANMSWLKDHISGGKTVTEVAQYVISKYNEVTA